MPAPIDVILPRLEGVKANGCGKWKACCPAHDDHDPSLSIREADDGKLLLHCWAGCDTESIVSAIGLALRDLFPDSDQRPVRRGPSRAAVEHERCIVAIGLSLLAQGGNLLPSDLERLKLASRRLAQLEIRV